MFIKKMFLPVLILALLATMTVTAQEPLRLKLNALERFEYLALLPEKASLVNWNIINDLKTQLAPNNEELKLLDLKPSETGGINGNWNAVPKKEIVFGESAEKLIADALQKLDREGQLSANQYLIYKQFVLKETPEE